MPATLQTVAGELAEAFESAERSNGDTFYKLRDGSPEWMTDAIHAAHGDMLPDDWRYKAIRAVAQAMADLDADSDLDDSAHEACDSLVDIYTSGLTAWLASRADRYCYCDDAAEEIGVESGAGIIQRLQLGQFAEYREIWDSLRQALEAEAEERPAEWSAGFNMPGFMPDSEPAEFDTWAEARAEKFAEWLESDIDAAWAWRKANAETAATLEAADPDAFADWREELEELDSLAFRCPLTLDLFEASPAVQVQQ